MTFTFDYHNENQNSFLGWMLVHLTSGLSTYPALWETIQKKTKGFSQVELTMQINGIDVPVDKFIEGIENNMQFYAEQAAAAKLDAVDDIYEVSEELEALKNVLRERKRAIAEKYDIKLYDED